MPEFDPKLLKQREDFKRQKLQKKPRAVTREEPPRAQARGQVWKGAARVSVEECSTCARLYKVERYGVPKQHVRQHLEDHKMGKMKKVSG